MLKNRYGKAMAKAEMEEMILRTKAHLEENIEHAYNFYKSYANDKNPQVVDMANKNKNVYESLDEVHYKMFRHYYKSSNS